MAGRPSVSGFARLVMNGEGPARVPDEVIDAREDIAGLWLAAHWANLASGMWLALRARLTSLISAHCHCAG